MADSNTHTQDGPWVDAGLTGPNPRIHGGPLRLIKCEGVVIAFLPAWLRDHAQEARANARLIAAAPALLEALQDLVDTVTGQMEGETVALHNALAAIAQAKGPTP